MAIEDYSDAQLKAELESAYLLALEAGDTFIPHDPHEWGGLGRYSAYRDMMDLVRDLEEELRRRGLDYEEAERSAEVEWERKHGEWS